MDARMACGRARPQMVARDAPGAAQVGPALPSLSPHPIRSTAMMAPVRPSQGSQQCLEAHPVRIRRLSFVGVQTERSDAMAAFVRDVLGLAPGHRDDGWAVFQLESGDRDFFEVYHPGDYDERLLPAAATGPTVAFAVDDLVTARAELVASGVEIVADIVWAAEAFHDPRLEGFGWLFFRAPDGHVYALQQDHAPSAPGDRGTA